MCDRMLEDLTFCLNEKDFDKFKLSDAKYIIKARLRAFYLDPMIEIIPSGESRPSIYFILYLLAI